MINTMKSFTQLTGAGATSGVTDAFYAKGFTNHVMQIDASAIGSAGSAVCRFEGRLKRSGNYFNMGTDQVLTSDGTYKISVVNHPIVEVRGYFVSEAGTAGATIDFTYMGEELQ